MRQQLDGALDDGLGGVVPAIEWLVFTHISIYIYIYIHIYIERERDTYTYMHIYNYICVLYTYICRSYGCGTCDRSGAPMCFTAALSSRTGL